VPDGETLSALRRSKRSREDGWNAADLVAFISLGAVRKGYSVQLRRAEMTLSVGSYMQTEKVVGINLFFKHGSRSKRSKRGSRIRPRIAPSFDWLSGYSDPLSGVFAGFHSDEARSRR
jgi:hypothetical protein